MSEKGVLSKSIASNISEAIIDKLGGAGYTPTEWSKNINLLGIASADIEEALASITEDTSSSDKGLLSLSIASDMGAMLNKKYNTSRGFKPSEVSSAVSALTPLPEKTASSAPICVFNDGANDVPLKSCEVALPASLDGYSSVDVVQTGKNLIKPDKYQAASNILTLGQLNNTSFDIFLKAGTYTISYETTGDSCYIYRREENDVSNTNMGKRLNVTFTLESDGNFRFWLYGDGAVFANISNVQLEVGSTTTAYTEYVTPTIHTASLGRTIYGGIVDVVKGTGTDENGNDFTFEPVEINSKLGNNTMWSNGGDTEVTYRADLDLYEAPGTLSDTNNTETEGNEEQEVNE